MPDVRYHAVVVENYGPARCLAFETLDEALAALREKFRSADQFFVFRGGQRLPTTTPPVCLKADDKLHPLYETPVEPDVDDAGFLNAAAGEDYEVAEKPQSLESSSSFDEDPADPFEDAQEAPDDEGF